MPVMPEGPLRAAGAHDQADRDRGDHALQVGASGRGEVRARKNGPSVGGALEPPLGVASYPRGLKTGGEDSDSLSFNKFLFTREGYCLISYSKATPSGSCCSNHVSAAPSLAKTFRCSRSPTCLEVST
jgi:hypothetical protein